MEWVNIAGLMLGIAGAAVLSYGLIVSPSDAVKLSLSTRGAKPDLEHLQGQGSAAAVAQRETRTRPARHWVRPADRRRLADVTSLPVPAI
jgi:hypothetical protein